MQIIDTDKDGMIVILYDSRWRDPTLLGYAPSSPQYKCLRELWERINNEEEHEDDRETERE